MSNSSDEAIRQRMFLFPILNLISLFALVLGIAKLREKNESTLQAIESDRKAFIESKYYFYYCMFGSNK